MNKLIFFAGFLAFVGVMAFALMREIDRNEAEIGVGISGTIHVAPEFLRDIVKTDNAHVFLFPPDSSQPVARRVINPFVPPINFYIGQQHALSGRPLQGSYRLLVISDKDGRIENPAPGEVIGNMTDPIVLGTERYLYRMQQPFRGLPPELRQSPASSPAIDPQLSIQGTMTVVSELRAGVSSNDRVVIMLFDMSKGRPVAMKFIPHFYDGQPFSIGQADAMRGQTLQGAYSLRILIDKNNQPFQSVPGEVIGRSAAPIPLGTKDLQFVLDTPYTR